VLEFPSSNFGPENVYTDARFTLLLQSITKYWDNKYLHEALVVRPSCVPRKVDVN